MNYEADTYNQFDVELPEIELSLLIMSDTLANELIRPAVVRARSESTMA